MAEGLNRVMLIGNLGQDPELRFTQGGQAVLNLRIATNESFLNRDNERQERTEWHTVIDLGQARRSAQQDPLEGQAAVHRGPAADALVGR